MCRERSCRWQRSCVHLASNQPVSPPTNSIKRRETGRVMTSFPFSQFQPGVHGKMFAFLTTPVLRKCRALRTLLFQPMTTHHCHPPPAAFLPPLSQRERGALTLSWLSSEGVHAFFTREACKRREKPVQQEGVVETGHQAMLGLSLLDLTGGPGPVFGNFSPWE